MNAHDIVHDLRYIAEQLRQAREISICPRVIDHIDDAQSRVWGLADELAPEILRKKTTKGVGYD